MLRYVENNVIGHRNTTGEDELLLAGRKLFGSMLQGVFAADELTVPRMLLNRQCCIVNLDERSSAGSHWIALAQDRRNILVYDSFGRHVVDGDVLHTEEDAEQHVLELNCGQRCLAWLLVFYTLGGVAALKI